MNKPFFTVVMPAYGVERYLNKAVESIQKQTFQDWELIIVEDGSPDRTGQVAEELKKRDGRIRVVHHENNRGLSEARNTGIDAAKGEYIWFMDPDDHVDADLLEQVFQSFQRNPADLAVFGHVEEYYDSSGTLNYTHEVKPLKNFFSDAEQLRRYILQMEQETIYGYAWNKVYHLEHIRKEKLRYETVRLIEDIVFNIQYCMNITSMNTLDSCPYHYAKRMEGSLTTKFVEDYYLLHRRRIEMLFLQQKQWGTESEDTRIILGSLYGRYILSALERNCDKRAEMKGRDRRSFCRKVFQDDLFLQLIPHAKARDSRSLAFALWCMQRRSVFLCVALGRIVHIVRESLPMLYSKVKSQR